MNHNKLSKTTCWTEKVAPASEALYKYRGFWRFETATIPYYEKENNYEKFQ